MAYDDLDEDGNDRRRLDRENDLGYECGRCRRVPTLRELNNGTCPFCRPARDPEEPAHAEG